MNIRKGDMVKIIKGKDRGKTGKVSHVHVKDGTVSVEGLHVFKKHARPKKQGEKGEVVSIVRPMDVSNVALICGSCNKQTRVGYRAEGEAKTRYCVKCSAAI